MKTWTAIVSVAIAALAFGLGIAWFNRPEPPPIGTEGAGLGDPRPGFRHGGLDGQWIDVDDFGERALLVNFWATWCEPCVREMPLLQAVAARHRDSLAVVGIAADRPDAVRDFVAELEIDYPIAVGAADVMDTQRRWGNPTGALPYTVFVDADGIIRWRHLGEVKADDLTKVFEQWL